MITDTITEEARDQIRHMQGEIERLTNQLVLAKRELTMLYQRYGHQSTMDALNSLSDETGK